MKSDSIRHYIAVTATLLGTILAGCAHIDTTSGGNPDRVLNGVVNSNSAVPAGAEVIVRLIEPPAPEPARTAGADIAVAPLSAPKTERVLGEFRQVIETTTQQPVPFRIEYSAEDSVLRRGVNLDVRISFGGKVRLRTVNAHVVTLASSPFKQDVWVQSVQ